MKRYIKKSHMDADFYGQHARDMYGDLIARNLAGQIVSKRVSDEGTEIGLPDVAERIGIDMWDLLEALEGMRYMGEVIELDDSTYEIL